MDRSPESRPGRGGLALHSWVGWITLVVFLATGQYMRYVHEPAVEDLEPALRMLFRSRHIYLLFAALLNLVAARQAGVHGPGWLRIVGSSLLVVSPVSLLTAFALETAVLEAPSALSIYGIQAAFAGTLCHTVAGWLSRRSAEPSSSRSTDIGD